MGISVICHSCGVNLKAPDKAAGRSIPCPKCKASNFIAPTTKAATTTPPTTVKRDTPETQALIVCNTCQRQIAATANACPGCGAANRWVHPEIERFNVQAGKLETKSPFKYDHTNTWIRGYATVKRQKPQAIVGGWCLIILGVVPFGLWCLGLLQRHPEAALASLAFIPLGIGLLIAAGFMKDLPEDVKFQVDLATTPPTWQSNDDEFWKPVKEFFLSPNRASR